MEKKHLVNIEKYRWLWFILSAILLLPGIVAMIYSSITYPDHMPLKVGIDYTGGTILNYTTDKAVSNHDLSDLRVKLEKGGVDNPFLQVIKVNAKQQAQTKEHIDSIISIRTKFIDEHNTTEVSKITEIVKTDYPTTELIQISSVGPTLGKELLKNSIIALSLALLGIIIYLSIRFQFDFAVTTVLALLHDAIFVIGCFSVLGLFFDVQIDGLFLTAVLTVIGFSVHDTIVVFDRIRENLKYYSRKMNFSEIVNLSVNQTLARSINTSLTTLITLLALYFFGGVTTRDFVLAMILGIAVGTYSSIFFASMLIDVWRGRKLAKA